jgi:hypothetical protein
LARRDLLPRGANRPATGTQGPRTASPEAGRNDSNGDPVSGRCALNIEDASLPSARGSSRVTGDEPSVSATRTPSAKADPIGQAGPRHAGPGNVPSEIGRDLDDRRPHGGLVNECLEPGQLSMSADDREHGTGTHGRPIIRVA